MKTNKTKNKKNEKMKILLKRILNIFCYVCTGILFFVLLIYAFASCSRQEEPISTTKFERFNAGPSISLNWHSPDLTFNDNRDSIFMKIVNNEDEYCVYYWQPSQQSFISDLLLRIDSSSGGSSHSRSFWLYDGSDLISSDDSYGYNVYNRSDLTHFEYFDYGDDFYSYNINPEHTYILICQGNKLTFNRADYDRLFSYFTYQGSTSSPSDYDSIYSYCSSNPYRNYLIKEGRYILNPYYDWSSVSSYYTHFHAERINFGNMQSVIGHYCDLYDFHYYSYSEFGVTYRRVAAQGFDAEYMQFSYHNEIANGVTAAGNLRWWNGTMSVDNDVNPAFLYAYGYVIDFQCPIPVNSYSSDFSLMFLPISSFGTLEIQGQFNFNYNYMLSYYWQLVTDNNISVNVRHWFQPDSQIILDSKQWCSFVTYFDYFTNQRWYQSLPYYAERSVFNSGAINENMLANSNFMALERLATFNNINVNDFLFFVGNGSTNLSLYSNPIDDNDYDGINPPSIINGIYSTFDVLAMSFDGIASLLSIEISKGLPIGAFILAPFAAFIIFSVLSLFRF